MSSKSELQEYTQKCKIPMPIYNDWRIDNGEDHIPKWKSLVIVASQEFYGEGKNKKEAQEKAAHLALFNIKQGKASRYNNAPLVQNTPIIQELDEFIPRVHSAQVTEQKIPLHTNIKLPQLLEDFPTQYILLIDVENVDFDPDHLPKNLLILIFAAKNTTKIKICNLALQRRNCFLMITKSVGKDAADHYMTFTLGQISLLRNKSQYVFILTRDKFGQNLEYFTTNCRHICSLNELYQ